MTGSSPHVSRAGVRPSRATPLGMLAIAAAPLGAQGGPTPLPEPTPPATVAAAPPLARAEAVARLVVSDAFLLVTDDPVVTELPMTGTTCAPGRCAIGAVRVWANRSWTLQLSLDPAATSGADARVALVRPSAPTLPPTPLVAAGWTAVDGADGSAEGAPVVVWLQVRAADGGPIPARALAAVSARLRFRVVPRP